MVRSGKALQLHRHHLRRGSEEKKHWNSVEKREAVIKIMGHVTKRVQNEGE